MDTIGKKRPEVRLSETAMTVLEKRGYLHTDSRGRRETPEEMFWRTAKAVAVPERKFKGKADVSRTRERFFEEMSALRFLPSSVVLRTAGQPNQQCAACFVVPVEDSLASIFDAVKSTGLVHQRGGGVGINFSSIRPIGDTVGSSSGKASGPVSFIHVIDTATSVVNQAGFRRGANMGILDCSHSNIRDFITAKHEVGVLPNFNLSVGVTDEFKEQVKSGGEYSLINPRTGKAAGRVKAREVFDLICEEAWNTGEPGLIFLDTINRDNPTPHAGEIRATNPCGEAPLLPHQSCVLGSVCLPRFLEGEEINWERLGKTVRLAVRFLDNCIEISNFPLAEIERATRAERRVGVGVMGVAQLLARMGIPYDSQEARDLTARIMKFISTEALEASRELAAERGAFPNFGLSVYAERGEPPVRNACRVCVAPTGTISIIADTSSGIEPYFALAYTRTTQDGETFSVVDPVFREIAEQKGIYTPSLEKEVARTGSIQGTDAPSEMKEVFKTTYEISPRDHVLMQAAVQNSFRFGGGVSKTVNMSANATVEDVRNVFLLANESGCKGVAVFRQGFRTPVLRAGLRQEQYVRVRERPTVTFGQTEKTRTGCGSLYVTVNFTKEKLIEVFSSLGKGGGCVASSEANARLVSLCLRSNVDPREVARQLLGIRCATACRARAENKEMVLSCPDGIARAILRAAGEMERDASEDGPLAKCPLCGGPREPGRCGVCLSCLDGGCYEG